MIYFFQEKLIFRSSLLPNDHTYVFESGFEELFLKAEDGAILNGLHFKQKNSKGVILYCHGNKGNLSDWGNWAQELSDRYGYDVVIWDYRGYGKSTGERNHTSMLNDGFLFYDYCDKWFNTDEIIIFGRSLGGFFATHVAKQKKPQLLILESTATSLLRIAENVYPILPSKYLLKYKFQSDENIVQISAPTYIIHGTDDGLIPHENGTELYELSPAMSKKLFSIENGGHNDLRNFKGDYFGALDEILN